MMKLMGVMSLSLMLVSCVSMDVRLVESTPVCPTILQRPSEQEIRHRSRDGLVLVPYPHKPVIPPDVKDHNEIERVLINHINVLHGVNDKNIKRVAQYQSLK